MNISEFRNHLIDMRSVSFKLPNGAFVPAHFHITEVGVLTKHFIDCGGDIHEDKSANIQIWVADDTEHRLEAPKLLGILDLSKKLLNGQDLKVEVEYQTDTIGKYDLSIENGTFVLVAKQTDCLAKEKCNIPIAKPKIGFTELSLANQSCCTPGSGCC